MALQQASHAHAALQQHNVAPLLRLQRFLHPYIITHKTTAQLTDENRRVRTLEIVFKIRLTNRLEMQSNPLFVTLNAATAQRPDTIHSAPQRKYHRFSKSENECCKSVPYKLPGELRYFRKSARLTCRKQRCVPLYQATNKPNSPA